MFGRTNYDEVIDPQVLKDDVLKLLLTNNRRGTKSIAEAIIDGSVTSHDYAYINRAIKSKTGEYTQEAAMVEFVQSIGPYLSVRGLFVITENLMKVEMKNEKNAFCGSPSLAQCFMVYELHRHLKKTDHPAYYPDAFIHHLTSSIFKESIDLVSVDEFVKCNIEEFIGSSDELLVKINQIRANNIASVEIQKNYFSMNQLDDEPMLDPMKYLRELRQASNTVMPTL